MKAVLLVCALALSLLPQHVVAQSPLLYANSAVFITNSKFSNVLDNYGPIIAENNTVGMFQLNGGSNQQWIYINVQNSSCVWIQNVGAQMFLKCDTNRCSISTNGTLFKATVDGKSISTCDESLHLTDGAKLQSANSTDNSQVWILNYAPTQYFNTPFFLTSNTTSKVFDNYGANIAENNQVGMYTRKQDGNSNQQWLLMSVQNSFCALIQNVVSQMYLNCDTNGCRLSSQGTSFKATTDGKISYCADGTLYLTEMNGAALMQNASSNNNQVWNLNFVNIANFPSSSPLSQFDLSNPFMIASWSKYGYVLDDYYRSQIEGNRVDLYQVNDGPNQQWAVLKIDPRYENCVAFQNQDGSKNMYLKCNGNGCFLSSTATLFAFSVLNQISTCDRSQYLTIVSDSHVQLQDYNPLNNTQMWSPPLTLAQVNCGNCAGAESSSQSQATATQAP